VLFYGLATRLRLDKMVICQRKLRLRVPRAQTYRKLDLISDWNTIHNEYRHAYLKGFIVGHICDAIRVRLTASVN